MNLTAEDEALLRQTYMKTTLTGVGVRVDCRNREQAERLERAGFAIVLDVMCGDGHRDRIFATQKAEKTLLLKDVLDP